MVQPNKPPSSGTLYIFTGPASVEKLITEAVDVDAGEFAFCRRMSTSADENSTETSAEEVEKLSALGMLAMRWIHDGATYCISFIIGQLLAKGRNVIVHGHDSMIQTARMKYRRVRVLKCVDTQMAAAQLKQQEQVRPGHVPKFLPAGLTAGCLSAQAELDSCIGEADRFTLIKKWGHEAVAAAQNEQTTVYEMSGLDHLSPTVAALVCALRSSAWHEAKEVAETGPAEQPLPAAEDIAETELLQACSAAGIEGADQMSEAEQRAALSTFYSSQALVAALARKAAAEAELLALNRDKIAQLKTYKIPPKSVHKVCAATMLVLGHKIKATETWANCRTVACADDFTQVLLSFDPMAAKLKKKRLEAIDAALQLVGGAEGAERGSIVALSKFHGCFHRFERSLCRCGCFQYCTSGLWACLMSTPRAESLPKKQV